VALQVVTPGNIDRLVEHMFDQVFSESERGELLAWIRRWDAENPDVDAAHRVTGWIDVAYLYQARLSRAQQNEAAARGGPIAITGWAFTSAFA
jgi:hypothetical protein